MAEQAGNLGAPERWLSVLAGLGLTLSALRRGSLFGRAAAGVAGVSLLSRGAAGHCAMKAALTGESSLQEGLRAQWERMREQLSGGSGAAEIHDMEALYLAELQELHSTESQLLPLVQDLTSAVQSSALERELRSYATEIRTRREDLDRMISSHGVNPREHPDQAMQALIHETHKMMEVSPGPVRDAALLASLQRLLHFKIAGYGSVATFAKTIGRVDEAARLAEYSSRDKTVDATLTDIAKSLVNPEAQRQAERGPAFAEQRPH